MNALLCAILSAEIMSECIEKYLELLEYMSSEHVLLFALHNLIRNSKYVKDVRYKTLAKVRILLKR